jgi:hypothetical protein
VHYGFYWYDAYKIPSIKKKIIVTTDNILGKDNIKLNYIVEEGKMIKILQFPLPYRSPNKALNMHILPNIIGIIAVMKYAEWMKEETEVGRIESTWELEEFLSRPINIYGSVILAAEICCSHTMAVHVHACHIACFNNSVLSGLRQYYFSYLAFGIWSTLYRIVFSSCSSGQCQTTCLYLYLCWRRCVSARNTKLQDHVARLADETFIMNCTLCLFEVA